MANVGGGDIAYETFIDWAFNSAKAPDTAEVLLVFAELQVQVMFLLVCFFFFKLAELELMVYRFGVDRVFIGKLFCRFFLGLSMACPICWEAFVWTFSLRVQVPPKKVFWDSFWGLNPFSGGTWTLRICTSL